jgi:hypothetical protein
MPHVLVWDIETVPDLKGFAAAHGHDGKTDDEIRAELGERPVLRWQSWRDEVRTQMPKPLPMVWGIRQKQKKNQSEQIETGGPGSCTR